MYLMDLFGFVDLSGFVVFTFQQLSCDGESDALSHDIRKAYQSAWFDQNPPYETIL